MSVVFSEITVCVYIYIYIYIYICVCVCVCVCIYIYMCVCIYIYIYIYNYQNVSCTERDLHSTRTYSGPSIFLPLAEFRSLLLCTVELIQH